MLAWMRRRYLAEYGGGLRPQTLRGLIIMGTALVTASGIILQTNSGLQRHWMIWVPALVIVSVVTGWLAVSMEGLIKPEWESPAGALKPQVAVTPEPPPVASARFLSPEMPATTHSFTGRTHLLERMRSIIAGRAEGETAIIALYGIGGVGKTQVALRFARDIAGEFPDGVLWASMQGPGTEPLDPSITLAVLLGQLGLASTEIPSDAADRSQIFRARLARGRYLVVLDNVSSASQVKLLLPASPGCAVLLTSRSGLGLVEATALEVTVMPREESVELLGKIIGEQRVAAHRGTAAEIAGLCGHLPLAVRIAGARLQQRTDWELEDLAVLLRDEYRRLTALEIGDASVRASVSVSYRALDEEHKRAFRLLALVRSASFASWILGPLLDVGVDRAEAIMQELVEARLVETGGRFPDGWPRFRLHGLLRVYGREQLAEESDEALGDARTRLFGAYLVLAEHAAVARDPHFAEAGRIPHNAPRWHLDDPALRAISTKEPTKWLIVELRPMARSVQQAFEHEMWAQCWEMAYLFAQFFEDLRSYWDRWQPTLDVAINAARAAGDRRGEAQLLRVRGTVFRDADRLEEAAHQLNKALGIFGVLGDRFGEAQTLRAIGIYLRARGQFAEATEHLDRAYSLSRELGDRLGAARARRDVGGVYHAIRMLGEADWRLLEALGVFTELGDEVERAATLRTLGSVRRQQRRFDEADGYLAEAMAVAVDFGDRAWRAKILVNIGRLRLDQDRVDEADTALTEATEIFREYGYRLWSARVRRGLAQVRLAQRRFDEAEEEVLGALVGFRTLDLELWEAHGERTRAGIYQAQGRFDEASALLAVAVEVAGRYGDTWSAAEGRLMLGAVWRNLGLFADSVAVLQEADEVFRQFGDTWHRAEAIQELSTTHRAAGRRTEARTLANLASELRES